MEEEGEERATPICCGYWCLEIDVHGTRSSPLLLHSRRHHKIHVPRWHSPIDVEGTRSRWCALGHRATCPSGVQQGAQPLPRYKNNRSTHV